MLAGGRITAVGRRASIAVPAGAAVVDVAGLVITAGFQNSHVHFTDMTRWADAGKQPAGTLTNHLREMVTRYGFTTVVDTASDLDNTTALRRRIESAEVLGPRVLTAGFAIYPPDGGRTTCATRPRRRSCACCRSRRHRPQRRRVVQVLVSDAVGALLRVALLDLLPEASAGSEKRNRWKDLQDIRRSPRGGFPFTTVSYEVVDRARWSHGRGIHRSRRAR